MDSIRAHKFNCVQPIVRVVQSFQRSTDACVKVGEALQQVVLVHSDKP